MDTINEFWKVNSDMKQHSRKLEKLNKRLTLLVLYNKTCLEKLLPPKYILFK